MSKLKNLLVNVGVFTLNALATKLVTFFLVPLYTYYMTASEYGITDMSLTVISLATPLVTLSVADAAVRYIVGDKERTAEYTAIGFGVTLLSVLFVWMLSPILDLGIFGGLGDYKGLFILAYAASAMLQLCGEVARGMGEIKLIPICSGISSLVTCGFAVVLIGMFRLTVVGYFLSVSIGPIVAVCVYLSVGGLGRQVRQGMSELYSANDKTDILNGLFFPMLRYALPLIPNSIFWWVSTSINRFFITAMLGIAASGMFAAAGKIPNLLNTAYSIFQQAWQLSAFQASREDGLDSFFTSVFRALQAAMTILCASISLSAPWIAIIFLQGEFYNSWPMISLLLLANLMNVFNSFFGTIYTTTMHTGYIMRTTIVGAVVCVALTPVLIPCMGIYGACAASAVSQFSVFVMRAIDSKKYISFNVGWRLLIPTLVALVVQSVVTASQIVIWQSISLLCTILIVCLQCRSVAPVFRTLHAALRNRS